MIDTLAKMSGTKHEVLKNSKTVTTDLEKLLLPNEGKVSYTLATQEMPVIQYNDMAFISERNSMVFRAGDSPVWNRNETILPMSWRLFSNTITQPGKEYSLQTVPTLSSALDFDVRKNQPDFTKMWEKRKMQAVAAAECREAYMNAYGFSEYDMEQLDPDNVSDEIMEVINQYVREQLNMDEDDTLDAMDDDLEGMWEHEDYIENEEQAEATAEAAEEYDKSNERIYAGGNISRSDLVNMAGVVNHGLDSVLYKGYLACKGDFWQDRKTFVYDSATETLKGIDGKVYIGKRDIEHDVRVLRDAVQDKYVRVFDDGTIEKKETVEQIKEREYYLTDDFYKFLASQPSWSTFAKGRFDEAVSRSFR